MENNQNEQFIVQLDIALNQFKFGSPEQTRMIKNDILARNQNQAILQPLHDFIKSEYKSFMVDPESDFKSKEDIYTHLVNKGLTPLTNEFHTEYRRICVASKLM